MAGGPPCLREVLLLVKIIIIIIKFLLRITPLRYVMVMVMVVMRTTGASSRRQSQQQQKQQHLPNLNIIIKATHHTLMILIVECSARWQLGFLKALMARISSSINPAKSSMHSIRTSTTPPRLRTLRRRSTLQSSTLLLVH